MAVTNDAISDLLLILGSIAVSVKPSLLPALKHLAKKDDVVLCMHIMTYQYFGILAFIVLLVGLLFIVWKWPEGQHHTFSQHVAVRKERILYYVLLFSVVLPLLLCFFIGWFVPTFELSAWFNVYLSVSSITQYVCTLIPEVGGWRTTYHRLLAGISAVFLLPPLFILLMAGSIATGGKVLAAVGLLVMLGIICLVAAGRGTHRRLLVLQASYFAAFFLPILYIAYGQ